VCEERHGLLQDNDEEEEVMSFMKLLLYRYQVGMMAAVLSRLHWSVHHQPAPTALGTRSSTDRVSLACTGLTSPLPLMGSQRGTA